jgi:CubicO group peptidase (beta-lactamase class C family)
LTLKDLFPRQEGVQYWFRTPGGNTSLACSGLATRTPPSVVAPATTFHCFSTTKPVTALAVLQLVAGGLIGLDEPLIAYLPDLPYRNGATVRQVLSHQAGLPNPMPLSWVHLDVDHSRFDAAGFLERILRENPHCDQPGRRMRYSNIGFLLLGRLVETVSRRSYMEYVRERILDVVHCSSHDDGRYLGFDLPPGRHATGYTRRWSATGLLIPFLPGSAHLRTRERGWIGYRPFHVDGPAYGGLKGNALGWAALLTAIARRDPQLLPAKMYDWLFAPQTLASGAPTGHALSWSTGRLCDHDYLCHAGGGPGYAAEIRVYPSLGAASVLLSNTTILHDARLLDGLDVNWLH